MSVVTASQAQAEMDELLLLRNDLDDPEFRETPAGKALHASMGKYLEGCLEAANWALGNREYSPILSKPVDGKPRPSEIAYESMMAEDMLHAAEAGRETVHSAQFLRGLIQGLEWFLLGDEAVRPSRAF